MYPEAITALQKVIGTPGDGLSKADLGHVYGVSGSKREARRILNELQELSQTRYVAAFNIAVIHAGLGDKAEALAWLEKAYDERSFFLASLNVDPRFDPLRAEPRFRALVQRIGLTSKSGANQ